MPTWAFRLGWAIWAAFFLIWEAWSAWFDKESGDTLSEQVWILLKHPMTPWWFIAMALLIWVTIHFLTMGRWG
jgi:ribose/xylose/arabinose/galactoside ABC-type transport system permease subunit